MKKIIPCYTASHMVLRRAGVLAAAIVVSLPWSAFAQTAQTPQTQAVLAPSIQPPFAAASSAAISRVAMGAETLHVIVGHSLFLNTKFRLRRVYVADPVILNSVTLTPNQIIVTAMSAGISSLVLLDETGQAQSYVVSSDVDVQGLRTAISEAMHDDAVNVEGMGSRVILSGRVGSDARAETAVKLAALYSKEVSNSLTVVPEHPRQVRLKVRILEVDRSKLTQFGVNLFNPGGNTSFLASTTTSQYPSTSTLNPSTAAGTIATLVTSSPLNFLLYSAKLNLGATVQDLESKQVLQVLAEPTITTISGQKANFLAGGEFPFPVIQPGGGASTTASVTISFRPYGVKLEFTPIVNDDGTIRLKVAPEVSALDYTNAVTISGYTIPALSTRKAETEVELRSDQSFAISGLLDQRTTDILSKTPGAASIPIIGALFKSKNINHSTTELVVIITPTLVDPLTDGADPDQPGLPIAPMNPDTFDKSLGNRRNPNPAPPPLEHSPAPARPAAQAAAAAAGAVPSAASPVSSGVAEPAVPVEVPAAPATVAIAAHATGSPITIQQDIDSAESALAPAPSPESVPSSSTPASQVPQRYVFDNPALTASGDAQPPPTVEARHASMVQIMALSHREDAAPMVASLKRRGYDVAVNQSPGDTLLHLEVGPFVNRSDAEAMRARLMSDGYNATLR